MQLRQFIFLLHSFPLEIRSMADIAPPAGPRRWLSLDGWAVLLSLVLTALIWADLLPAVRW
jgi:hypothetical protein